MSSASSRAQANGNGAVVRGGINDRLAALYSLNSGESAPADPVAGMLWYKPSTGVISVRDSANAAWLPDRLMTTDGFLPYWNGVLQNVTEQGFADGDTTPSTESSGTKYARWKTANTSATSITNFDDEEDGQELWLRVLDGNTTLVHNASVLKLIAGQNVKCVSGDLWHFRNIGGVWHQLPDGLGMGQPGVVRLATPASITDWASAGATGDQTVDLTSEGVPAGAREALIEYTFYTSDAALTATFKSSGGVTSGSALIPQNTIQNFNRHQIWVPLDASAQFKVNFSSAWTVLSNTGSLIAYRK